MATRTRWILGLVLVAAVALLILWWNDLPETRTGMGGSPTGHSDTDGPLLVGRGEEAERASGDESGGAVRPQRPVGVEGTVCVGDTTQRVTSGAVILHYLLPRAGGPEVQAAFLEAFRDRPENHREVYLQQARAPIASDGSFRLDLPRNALLHLARVMDPAVSGDLHGCLWDTKNPLGEREAATVGPLTLRVACRFVVRGHVVHAVTGDPIPGAFIECRGLGQPWFGDTDESGSFRAMGPIFRPAGTHLEVDRDPRELGTLFRVSEPPREFELAARHRDYLSQRVRVSVQPGQLVHEGVRFELERGMRIAGRVVLADPLPRNSRTLRLLAPDERRLDWAQAVRLLDATDSDEAGRFLFWAVPPTRGATLRLLSANESGDGVGCGATLEDLDCTRDRDDLVLHVARTTVLAVEARYPDDVPVPAAGMVVVVTDPDGISHTARYGLLTTRWFRARPGLPHEVRVFALRAGSGRQDTRYVGETRVIPREDSAATATVKVIVALRQAAPHPKPPCPDGVMQIATTAVECAHFTWLLRVLDARSAEPLAKRYVEIRMGVADWKTRLSEDGVLMLHTGLGRRLLLIHVPGYERRHVVVNERCNGFREATIALDPLPAR